MRIFSIKSLLMLGACALILSSCKVTTTTKNVRFMDIEFDSLNRKDFTLVKDLTATATVYREKSGKLASKYANNYKLGTWTSVAGRESWDRVVMKFKKVDGKWKLVPEVIPMRDAGADFALYALIEKYPDIDYLVNVRIERISVKAGSGETITCNIKADGIELRTDKK